MFINRGSALILTLVLLFSTSAWADPPKVLVSQPANGAAAVPTDVGKISIFFNRPMKTGSWSFLKIDGCKYPPIIMAGSPWQGNQALVLSLDKLDPGVRYGLRLGHSGENGFKAADDNAPLAATEIVFTTAGNAGPTTPPPNSDPVGGAPPGRNPGDQGGGAPADGKLTEQQRVNLNLIGSAVGILFHEMGHCFIEIFKLPFTGREEDAVDEFSIMLLTQGGKEGFKEAKHMVAGVAEFFYLLHKYGGRTPWWDEHTDPEARFANVMCYLYGSSPDEFHKMMLALKVPERRLYFCRKDYPRKVKTWESLLKPYTREAGAQGPGKMKVVHEKVTAPWAVELQQTFQKLRLFENLAEAITKEIALPYDITLRIIEGEEPIAHWDPDKKEIVFGYSMTKAYADLLKKDKIERAKGGDGGGKNKPKPRTRVLDARLFGTWMGQVRTGYPVFTLQVQFDQKGQYYTKSQLAANNQVMAYEEEGGLYEAKNGKIHLTATQSSDASNVNSRATLSYGFQGANLIVYGVPAVSGQAIMMQRMQ